MNILFWSGGKDSYLALCHSDDENLKLLTTYDETSGQIPFQNLAVQTIQNQADFLDLDILFTALPPECPNITYLERVEETLNSQDKSIQHLIFGDWMLPDVRQWREKQFNQIGYSCKFPIWQKNLSHFLKVLHRAPVDIQLSYVSSEYQRWIQVGDIYDQSFVESLPDHINPMGEKGEFHTEVKFQQ